MLNQILERLNSTALISIFVSRIKGSFQNELDFSIIENEKIIYSDKGFTQNVFRKLPKEFNRFLGKTPVIFAHEVGLENDTKLLLEDLETPFFWEVTELAKISHPFEKSFELQDLSQTFELEDSGFKSKTLCEIFEKSILSLRNRELKTIQLLQRIAEKGKSEFEPLFKSLLEVKVRFIGEETIGKNKQFAALDNVFGSTSQGFLQNKAATTRLMALKIDKILEMFSENGTISQNFQGYEKRQEQIQLVENIANAFNNGDFLIAEAQTGTGKSIAYLVPSIFWTVKNSESFEKVVVTTRTKNLQEQLFFKDIPYLGKILNLPFKAVLLKGRSNYLCLTKWDSLISNSSKFTEEERRKLLSLVVWFEETKTGEISENNAFNSEKNTQLWSKLASETGFCSMNTCKHPEKCFIGRVRNEAKTANLVLINHSLLFSDLVSENNVIGEYSNLIVDEAHSFEKTATNYFGKELNIWLFRSLNSKIYSNETHETGFAITLSTQLKFAHEIGQSTLALLNNQVLALKESSEAIKSKGTNFFTALTEQVKKLDTNSKNQENIRFKIRYLKDSVVWKNIEKEYQSLLGELGSLTDKLNTLGLLLSDLKDGILMEKDEILQELKSCVQNSQELLEILSSLVENFDEEQVYWFELSSKKDTIDTRVFSVPLDVSSLLSESIYKTLQTLVFTSATLSAGDSEFSYFRERLGLDLVAQEKIVTASYGSPFDYENNCKLIVPSFLPEPSSKNYNPETLKLISEVLETTNDKGCLILCTSYAQLNYFAKGLLEELAEQNRTLLIQGKDGSRTALISRFRELGNAVLIGTDSFWEGIDVTGNSLSVLIITKIPFEVPDEPIVKAQMEKIEKEGGNSFNDYYLPEAIVKFRQGFGRLIRTKTDKGVVIVTDTRVVSKGYGKKLTSTLPLKVTKVPSIVECRKEIINFFRLKNLD
ncbi:DEAD/DEAH box helicase family protein [bacterium]|nr:DEAD/DEAH box helicase family protein [bacterium]